MTLDLGSVWRPTDRRRTETRFVVQEVMSERTRPAALVTSIAPDGRERTRIISLDRLDRYERIDYADATWGAGSCR